MSGFYCPPESIKEGYIYLKPDEAHHVYKVMRLRAKDRVVVFDGSSKEYEGVIISAGPKSVTIKIEKTINVSCKEKTQIAIGVGLPKGKKMELIIQKATELGVDKIIPVKTERSQVFLDKLKEEKKIVRWQEIAKAACKQSGNLKIPKVDISKSFDEIIKMSKDYKYIIMPCFHKEALNIKDVLEDKKPTKDDKILILIGPEGGFSVNEIKKALENCFLCVSLGKMTLKTETAVFYMMSVFNFYLGI